MYVFVQHLAIEETLMVKTPMVQVACRMPKDAKSAIEKIASDRMTTPSQFMRVVLAREIAKATNKRSTMHSKE
jgi:hypothetical protein